MDPVIEDRIRRIQAHARYPQIKEWFERYLDKPYYTQERCHMVEEVWLCLTANDVLAGYAERYKATK
jgi:hypothetical protein